MSTDISSTTAVDVSSATFDELVNGSPVPVLVDFWAEWCPPCHALAAVLEEIAVELAGSLRVAKVDVDAHPDLSLRFDVMSLPSTLVFVDGQVVRRLVGARGKHHLLAELDDVLGPVGGVGRIRRG
jgi:thioredoxin 1